MIARRTRDVAELNERARQLLVGEGRVGREALSVEGQEFAAGDRVVTRLNTSKVSNRERWDVVAVDTRKQRLHLRSLRDEAHGVVLDRAYLDRKTKAGEPAIQHAYALTTYTTQSKTFDSAFALLDSEISSEDFTVAISRNVGPVFAYGVAASELTDPELGPGLREIEDAMHELRAGSERTAGEFAAIEVALRKRIEAKPAGELASRRGELEARRLAEAEPSPLEERLAAVEQRIASGSAHLAELATERAAMIAQSPLNREGLTRLEARQRRAIGQMGWLEAERDGLAVETRDASRSPTLSPTERAELIVIEDRLAHLARREASAARKRAPQMIEELLGARPEDLQSRALERGRACDLQLPASLRRCLDSRQSAWSGISRRFAHRDRLQAERRLAQIRQGLADQPDRSMRISR